MRANRVLKRNADIMEEAYVEYFNGQPYTVRRDLLWYLEMETHKHGAIDRAKQIRRRCPDAAKIPKHPTLR